VRRGTSAATSGGAWPGSGRVLRYGVPTTQRAEQHLLRLGRCPARIDERDAAVASHGVGIDAVQVLQRQRQRDPNHVLGDGLDLKLGVMQWDLPLTSIHRYLNLDSIL